MLETMRASRAAGPVSAFEAVLNGTVNFMLDSLDLPWPGSRTLAHVRKPALRSDRSGLGAPRGPG